MAAIADDLPQLLSAVTLKPFPHKVTPTVKLMFELAIPGEEPWLFTVRPSAQNELLSARDVAIARYSSAVPESPIFSLETFGACGSGEAPAPPQLGLNYVLLCKNCGKTLLSPAGEARGWALKAREPERLHQQLEKYFTGEHGPLKAVLWAEALGSAATALAWEVEELIRSSRLQVHWLVNTYPGYRWSESLELLSELNLMEYLGLE